MLKLFGLDAMGDFYFRHGPLGLALGLLVPAAALYAVYLYRRQPVLSPGRRVFLGILRAVVYAVLILLLFAPVMAVTKTVTMPSNILVLLDVSESMTIRDQRKRPEELADAAAALGKCPLDDAAKDAPPGLPADVKAEVGEVQRLDLAKGILRLPELETLRTVSEDRRVTCYTFGDKLEPVAGDPAQAADWLEGAQATAKTTRLGDNLLETVQRHSGQSITAVVVLTDGASNEGTDPLEAARRLRERSVPVHTVGLGLAQPNDVRIQTLLVPDTVFHKDKVPLRVILNSNGFQGRAVDLTLTLDGRPAASKSVELKGGVQFEELSLTPDRKGGDAKLVVEVSRPVGDVAPDNNRVERTLTVIDEKIKVLYVEGKPRWEYRYLRGVLTRDQRMDLKFLLTEGDRDLAKASEQYIDRFPDEAAAAFRYDLVILGDVPLAFFTPAQLARIEELVSKQGGSLLMLAGHQHAPMGYQGTPIAAMLPVKVAVGGRDRVESSLHPVPTDAGLTSLMVSLDPSVEKTRELWSMVRPLYDLPRLEGLKPGATLLATLSDSEKRADPYPLIAWQRYGTGKSLFVGTDQLWRLRFKRGDEYHARFWRQAIQFLTLSRLLGENKRIRLETDRRTYRVGERVQIYANVLDDVFEPVVGPSYTVLLESPGRAEAAALVLEPVPGSAGLYQGFFTPDQDGGYQLKTVLQDKSFSNSVSFQAVAASREMLDPAMQEQTLRRIAELTGGQYLAVRDLARLPELLEGKSHVATVVEEKSLWDRWYVVAFLVICLGTEWFVRRQQDAA